MFGKTFEILCTVMAILVRFEQFAEKSSFKWFAPNSECFTKYDAFCPHIFDYACLRCKAYCFQIGSKFKKIVGCLPKTVLKSTGWDECIPLIPTPPGSAPEKGTNI